MIFDSGNSLTRLLQNGRDALSREDWAEAGRCGEAAVRVAAVQQVPPAQADAFALLGLAQLGHFKFEAALTALQQAAQLDRHNPERHAQLAQAALQAGQPALAETAFQRARKLAPVHWPYAEGLAIALAQQQKFTEAETLLSRLADRYPQQASLRYNLGKVLHAQGKPAEAEQQYRTALGLTPEDPDIVLSLGSALHQQSRFVEAEAAYRRCITAHPDWTAPRLNLVSALMDEGRFSTAETECAALLAIAPELPEAHRFLGATRGHQGNLAGALAAFRAEAALQPQDPAALRHWGGALAECGALLAGLRTLACIAPPNDDNPAVQQLLSMIHLAHGQYAEGWLAYRHRPAFGLLAQKWAEAGIQQNLPQDLSGKRVLVRREQGIGDEIFFLRHLPTLKARGATVMVYASAKIADLVRRCGIADAVFADNTPPPDADVQILCGDLPHALHAMPASEWPASELPASALPHHDRSCAMARDFSAWIGAYWPLPQSTLRIPALPEATARMREQLAQAGTPPYIGITWRAGTAAHEQQGEHWVLNKNIAPDALGRALRSWPGTLIALQRHPATGEIEQLSAASGRPLADFTAINETLEDMLALLDCIDDYAGVSNTNMHLRAATGKTARVLVPNPAEWRWMHWGRQSPWFPGFRIYRQSMQGDWKTALTELTQDLAQNPAQAPDTPR